MKSKHWIQHQCNLDNSSITPRIRHVLPHCCLLDMTFCQMQRPVESCEKLLKTATAQSSPMSPSAQNRMPRKFVSSRIDIQKCTNCARTQTDARSTMSTDFVRGWPRQFEETLSLWICFHSQPPLPASCERLHHKHQDPRWSIQRGKVGSVVDRHSLDLLEQGKQCWAPDRSIRPQHIQPSKPWMEPALKLRFDPRLQRPKEWSPPSWLCEQLPPDR